MSADATNTDDIGGSGYTLDDLSDYLDAGRQPANPAIDDNAECQAALASLERVGALSRDLVDRDAVLNPTLDESWLGTLLSTIARETRAGRDLPLADADTDADEQTELVITEGAVRELARTAGDAVPGVIVGACRIEIGETTTVSVSISVLSGVAVRETADVVRQRVFEALTTHTALAIASIDVTVTDLHVLPTNGGVA